MWSKLVIRRRRPSTGGLVGCGGPTVPGVVAGEARVYGVVAVGVIVGVVCVEEDQGV